MAPRARCAGAFGVHARAAVLRWNQDPGHGQEGQAAALGCWCEVLSPHPQFRRCPFPLLRVGLFTSCSAATRGSAPPDTAARAEPRGPQAFRASRRVGRGLDWTSVAVLRAEFSPPPRDQSPSGCFIPAWLVVCRELHVLGNLLSVGKAGGASGQGAVLSGFLETKIGGVRLRD